MGQSHPVFARVYARARLQLDAQGMAEHRKRLLDGLRGRVLEVGAGDGGNFAYYPAGVTSVVAVEPEPYLRVKAGSAAYAAHVPVEVVNATADSLPLTDAEVDGVVTSLVLCSVPDQAVALAEIFRVLRPGGELRFYEHVAAAPGTGLDRFQRFADATVWSWFSGGCHVHRDTAAAITAAGFTITSLDRFSFGPDPASPHILGTATKPSDLHPA